MVGTVEVISADIVLVGSFAEDMGTVEDVVSFFVIVGSVKMLKVVAVVVEFVRILVLMLL